MLFSYLPEKKHLFSLASFIPIQPPDGWVLKAGLGQENFLVNSL